MAVQTWAIGCAMLVGLQIYQRLAPGLVTPEVFERALGLLGHSSTRSSEPFGG